MRNWVSSLSWIVLSLLTTAAVGQEEKNLLADPSFELTKSRDQFGLVFQKWGGWKYEGDCELRVGQVAHSGKTSCLIFGGSSPKIRTVQSVDLEPGRYRITAYVRGLDIGAGVWNQTTEFMFDSKYMNLKKNGTFGWTKLTYVGQLTQKKKAGPSFGLMAPGYFWIDDVSLVKVGDDVPLTPAPVLGQEEESPIAPPADLGNDAIRCAECGYKNSPKGQVCYACGTKLEAKKTVAAGPAVKPITSFEDKSPFANGKIVEEHATDGKKSLRLDKSYAVMTQRQDWSGYDYLKIDTYTDSTSPVEFYFEVRDTETRDYWTRVNYNSIIPPGQSTLIIPIKQLYVGEKSRPGRMLNLTGIVAVALSIGDKPGAPVYFDNVRLEREESVAKAKFDGLWAFDFGTSSSPVMEGFTQIQPGTLYSKGRGYGLKGAKIWRTFDALQPDPLYQDFICIESGGLAVDLPNGKYRVWMNIDNPSGFWGEYQVYKQRTVLAQGKPVVSEKVDFEAFRKKYFRFWNAEDMPADNTFDKYQKAYYQEKTFDVDVSNGQLTLDFQGENWACSVATVVIFPVEKATQGEQFLKWVEGRRRFHFDNYFKRILHKPTGDPLAPTADDTKRGYVVFQRDIMKDLYYNDTPAKDEIGKPLALDAFAGELESASLAVLPLADLGKLTVSAADLSGPAGTIPAAAVDVGFVSYRVTRVSMEGSVYTIAPRMVMPMNATDAPKGVARQFWLTIRVPADAKPGLYSGVVSIKPEKGELARVPIDVRIRKGTLDPADVPAGPWGYEIGIPWHNDPAATAFNQDVIAKALRKMREYGCTTFSGLPHIPYRGFKNGKPVLDFALADAEMKLVKELGFLAVITYGGGVGGINAYYQDTTAMTAAGFKDYSEFVKAIYTEVQKHAETAGWAPVFYNLGDEPIGADLVRSAENAAAYKKAFPKGPPYFTAASSYAGKDPNDPHFKLAKELTCVNWNGHSEDSIGLLHGIGADWAFYNGGNRWTFGDYMYKAVKQFGMKFRVSWHWNACAGDPYYALDCREDDYAWCTCSPDGRLIPAVHFEHIREGIDDYRRMLTLARLCKEKAGTPAATAGEKLIADRLASFKLGQRDHDPLFGEADWSAFRAKINAAIEALR